MIVEDVKIDENGHYDTQKDPDFRYWIFERYRKINHYIRLAILAALLKSKLPMQKMNRHTCMDQ